MSDTVFHCAMCEGMMCHPTEEELDEQRRELAIWNMVRDEVMRRQDEEGAAGSVSPNDAASMYTSNYSPHATSPLTTRSSLSIPESYYLSATSPCPDDTESDTQLRQELKEAKLRALYWQHQFTQDHAKHAEDWSQIKLLEEKLISADEKLDEAETKIEALEVELAALRTVRRRGTTGARALVGGPRDMERLMGLMYDRPSSR